MLKKIFKRLLTFALTICILMSNIVGVSYAAKLNETTEEKKAMLTALGILPEILDKKVKYETFADSMLNFLYDTDVMSAEDYVYSIGVLGNTGRYEAEASITLEDALKLAVETLGYAVEAQDTGYLAVATKLGLYDNIKISIDDSLDNESMVMLLYNMLDVEPCVVKTSDSGRKVYEVVPDENLLSVKRDIYEIKGMLTANEYTSIYGDNDFCAGHIKISGVLYECNYPGAEDLLGKNVEGYIHDNGIDTPEVVYLCENENKNETLLIEDENIASISNKFTHFYYYNENNKRKIIELSPTLSVIYNGKFYSDYTTDDLMPENGSVKFVDNNTDNVYDIAFVTSYQTMVVQSINTIDKVINSTFEYEGALKRLELKDDFTYSIYNQEGEIEFSDISISSVLSVALSKDEQDALCKIYVSTQTVEGNLYSKDTEDKIISIDGEEYDMSHDVPELINSGKALSIGKTYSFYIDYFGNVVFFGVVSDSPCYILRRFTSDELGETFYARYMDMNGEWHTSELAEKINCDGVSGKTVKFANKLRYLEPQIIKMKFNKEGKINRIIIAKQNAPYDEDVFRRTETTGMNYYHESNSFNTQYFFSGSTTTVVFPEESNRNNEALYYISNASSVFDENKSFNVSLYDPDEFNFVSLITCVTQVEGSAGSTGYKVVVSKGMEINEDDENMPYIKVYTEDMCGMKYIGATEEIFDNINVGDVITTHSNAQGRVDDVNKLFSLNDTFTASAPANLHNDNLMISGSIEKLDFVNGRVKLDCGSTVNLRINESATVIVYDKDDKKCELLPAAYLNEGDNLYIRMWYANIQEMICVRE